MDNNSILKAGQTYRVFSRFSIGPIVIKTTSVKAVDLVSCDLIYHTHYPKTMVVSIAIGRFGKDILPVAFFIIDSKPITILL